MPAPDYAAALIGWRVWCVVETARGLRLASVIRDQFWPVEIEAVARCEEPHAAPDLHCCCGIHAAKTPATVRSYLRGRNEPATITRVLGRVSLWGQVVEHEQGWRASHAYPLALFVGDAEIARELRVYGAVMSSYSFFASTSAA